MSTWFDDEFLREHWRPAATGKRGAPFEYSDIAIQALLMLKAVFHLPYRALEGFARSLMELMSLALPIPDHTHLSRRAKTLPVVVTCRASTEPRHIVVDSTGLKVYGEGEWKVRQHGAGKRRTWRKVHLAVDAGSLDVVGVEVTTAGWTDGEVFEGLLDQVEGNIEQIDGDGAYDTRGVYEAAAARGARLVVPPRDNAGYHRRSLAENAMYRLKQLFGDRLASRLFETQVTEVHVRVAAMNVMTALGMPVSECVGSTVS